MRVGKTRSHEQLEVLIEVKVLIGNLDQSVLALLDDLLLQNGVKHWVDFILDGLNEHWVSHLEWELEGILQVRVRQSHDAVLLKQDWFSLLDPVDGLTLRI